MKKYNQIRNKKTRAAGSEDMDITDKQHVCRWLKKHGYEYAVNLYMLVPKNIELIKHVFLLNVDMECWKDWKLVARPDICYWKRNSKMAVIEIDGKVHKKDLDMRPIYQEYGIRHIIINKEYLTKISKPWENYLDEKIQ